MEEKECEIWRKGQSCLHARIELFNNENGQLEMTSKFNIHIFPWGNIGEPGFAGDLHLSKANVKGEDAFKISF